MRFFYKIRMLPSFFKEKFIFHFRHYKKTKTDEQHIVIRYCIEILIYRKLLPYFFVIPVAGVYFILYPFCKIRFLPLIGAAMGHFAENTERLIIQLNEESNKKYKNIFYLPNSGFEPSVSNNYLLVMWKRVIPIAPLALSPFLSVLDRLLSAVKKNSTYNLFGQKKWFESIGFGPDIHGYFRDKKPLLSFTDAEHKLAASMLLKINIKTCDKLVCLLVRSADYHAKYQNWNDFPERNSDLNMYSKACYFLANKGYQILRMGKTVTDSFGLDHPNIIDYAVSDIRCDFLDIYLAAHCSFFISTSSGLESVAEIFRRPILVTNSAVLNNIAVYYPHYVLIFKTAYLVESGKMMSFREQSVIPFHTLKKQITEKRIRLIDNTEQEILDATIEMEARLTGSWIEIEQDKQLQEEFRAVFIQSKATNAHSKEFYVKIGRNFLLHNKNLLSPKNDIDQQVEILSGIA